MTHVHGESCNARTFPTTCRFCRRDVFFFSCGCGSAVFFDALGGDWPVHDCLSKLEKLKVLQDQIGSEALQRALSLRLERVGWRRANGVDQRYATRLGARVTANASRSLAGQVLRKVPTKERIVSDIGALREIVPSVDVWRTLGIDAACIQAVSIAKALPDGPLAQVTIHVGDLSEDDVDSYTCLCARRLIHGLARQQLVRFQIRGTPVLGREGFWLLLAIHPVD